MLDVDAPGYALGTKGNPDLVATLGGVDYPSPSITTSTGSKGATRDRTRPSKRPAAELAHAISILDAPAHSISAGGTDTGGAETFPNADYRRELGRALADAEILDRPATTVQAAATGRVSPAGHHERQFPADPKRMTDEVAGEPARTIDTTSGLQPPNNHQRQKKAVRLTVAQCAALQGFPPGFVFSGNKTSQHRQIGNACPPALAEHVGRAVLAALSSARSAAA